MSIVKSFLDYFWSPDFWLPPGTSWEDFQQSNKVNYPNYKDAVYAVPLAILMICMRRLVERTFLKPLGKWLGVGQRKSKKISSSPKVPKHLDEELIKTCLKSREKVGQTELKALAKRTDLDIRQIERWIRQTKLLLHRHSKLVKFCECGWRCICYTFSFSLGLYVMWDKPWFWDVRHCWYGYPHQSVSDDIWWYYLFGGGYYCSLLITQVFDVKRKDFWEMFVHHIVTIFLLGFSWVVNLIRIGTLVLILHDCVDIFIEAAKICKYANKEKLAEGIFAIFIVLWIVTRLGLYPFYVLHSAIFESPEITPTSHAFRMLVGLLLVLQILHIFWTYFILKVVLNIVLKGKAQDARSCTESASEISNGDENSQLKKTNLARNEETPGSVTQRS